MFQNAFEKLELADVATILDRVNPALDRTQFDPIETTIMAQDIPFYPGFKFLDIADYTSMPALQRFALYSPKKLVILNFTNDPIYRLNHDLPIKLTEDNVIDYARFFFTYVRGKHGRFLISEGVDDINWKDDPPPQARKGVGKLIHPVIIKTASADGYVLEACMMFKDSLFKSDVNVKANGFVSLSNEQLLVEDMPVLDDTFGQ